MNVLSCTWSTGAFPERFEVQLEASLTGGVPTSGFLDLRELLPHSLERPDVLKLLDCSESVRSCLQAGASLVSGVYLVSGELLKRTDAVTKKAGADLGERDLIAGTRSFPVGKAEAATVPLGGQPGEDPPATQLLSSFDVAEQHFVSVDMKRQVMYRSEPEAQG